MKHTLPFSAAEEASLRAAVAAAEARTAGEIVPWVVEASDDYPEAQWKGAALGALFGLGLGWALHLAGGRWSGGPPWLAALGWAGVVSWAVLLALLAAGVGFRLGGTHAGRRRLADADAVERRVRRAAEAAFLRGEVFATRARSGILIFVSLLEHRVVVLGDRGIHQHVRPEEWQAVADQVVAAMRRGPVAAALAAGVEAAGRLLHERGLPLAPGDVDELPDQPRYETP